ncbi:MAG: PD40 domain-containing protein [Planctomycetes bacterium]|nr:PD40 domain-containing protein [Planctomycetota bacterium]
MIPRSLLSAAALCGLALALPAQGHLLRFPDLHGDQIVFCHASDLWLVSAQGGRARRLTSHSGLELFPKFSPDGKWIAFTGQIDGDEQVYVIPSEGGEPRQLTFYPARGPLPDRWGHDHQVHGWTPDARRVVFRSQRDGWTLTGTRLFTVGLDGGLEEALPMPVSGAGDLSPDGTKLAYSPLTRDFRTWKRYQGGWAQELYVYDLAANTQVQITNDPRNDRDPMWIGERIYYLTDRTGKANLWSYDLRTKETAQETTETEWDLRWPSRAEDARIVLERAGELHVFSCKDRSLTRVPIEVPDEGLHRRPGRVSVERQAAAASLAPSGERILVEARGEVFSVPVEHGPTRNLTRTPGAHEKQAAWSPDGRWVAYVSDKSGEEQVWIVAQDGSGEPRMLTEGVRGMLYRPTWSPDSKRIAFSDKEGRLWVVEVAGAKALQIADEERGQLQDFVWSPCSGHLAWSQSEASLAMRSVWIWSEADQQIRRVTDPLRFSSSPAFDAKGERLFFLGRRSYAPRIGTIEFNFQPDRMTGVFALALRKDLGPLLPPRSDEVKVEAETRPATAAAPSRPAAQESRPASGAGRIDWEGLEARIEALPIEADNLAGLGAGETHLFYARTPSFYYGRASDRPGALLAFDLKERKAGEVSDNANGYDLSANGKKLLVREGNRIFVQDATLGGKASRKAVALSGLTMELDPRAEWLQIFDEVWRRYRDFFYAENMHGYDWEALRAQYRPLVARLGHRAELNYVLGEMVAELNAGHAYVSGGDWHMPERPRAALPGARFALDPASGRYRIARILRGENDDARYRSPLTEVGVQVAVGDYVLAIDGQELKAPDNPYRLLRHLGDQPVTLLVNDQPAREGAREVRYRGIASETQLNYWQWTHDNRERVARMTQGRVGYLHLPDMGEDGIREFVKWYYPQLDKEGLVIDVRANGGGNISRMVIERLRRVLLMGTFGRTTGFTPYPDGVFHGHLVCLLNQNSASDGDIFPAMFRRAGLGPLVGKRSWGGIVGITNRGTLVDGGIVNVPEFGNTELDQGAWTIEGHGVDPDFEVENEPQDILAGRDAQLEKAVELVMKAIQERPKPKPVRPPLPVKTGR